MFVFLSQAMDKGNQKSQYICKICDARAPNESTFQCHLQGKKHKQNVERLQTIAEEAERSVFVGNCMHLTATELLLADYFSKFGAISKITVDKNRGSFAIVEFDNKDSTSRVLSASEHEVMGIKLVVKPRETKLPASASKKVEQDKQQVVHQQMQSETWNMLLHADSADAQFRAILQNLSLNDDEKHLRNLLCQLLTTALEEVLHSCKIVAFGSSANGIGFHGCDVDLNLSYESVNYETAMQFFAKERGLDDERSLIEFGSKEVLEMASAIIKSCVPDCYQVRAILSARRPVVKFRHKASGICCDLSVGNDLAIQNTNYLRHICDKVPYFTPLVQAIKLWMKHWSLAGSLKAASPLLNNYAVTMLIIFYLNQTDELYSLNEMRKKDETLHPCVIESWDCSFSAMDPKKKQDTRNLQDLYAGFFKFYAKFEFANKIIHINSGDTENVKDFSEKSKEGRASGFKLGHLNIQDPFELNHNVAGNVGQKHMIVFTKCIRNAALACDMKIFNKSTGHTSKEPWGILCLFVDHHGKRSSETTQKEQCASLTEEIEIPNICETDKASIVMLIITLLTDVFMMSIDSENASGFSFESNYAGIESPSSSKALEDSTLNIQGVDSTSRKRHIEVPTPAPKKLKLSLSSPEAQKIYEKACVKSMKDGELSEIPLVFNCEVKYRLWEGRRKIRRQLVKPDMQEIMDLERQISKLLVAESHSHEESFTESTGIVNCISTGFLMDFSISLRGTNLNLVFAYDKATRRPSDYNTEQDFKNMAHHLKLSLPIMVKKCMRNK